MAYSSLKRQGLLSSEKILSVCTASTWPLPSAFPWGKQNTGSQCLFLPDACAAAVRDKALTVAFTVACCPDHLNTRQLNPHSNQSRSSALRNLHSTVVQRPCPAWNPPLLPNLPLSAYMALVRALLEHTNQSSLSFLHCIITFISFLTVITVCYHLFHYRSPRPE